MPDDLRRQLFTAPPGYTMMWPEFSGGEIRIMAQLEMELARSRALHLKDPDADDPFWARLCDDAVPSEAFETELLKHLGLAWHSKGATLVSIARKNARDLQDAYLVALDLVALL